MNGLHDLREDIPAILVTLILTLAAYLLFLYLVDRPLCLARTRDVDRPVQWSLLGGCRVEIEPGIWVRLEPFYYVERRLDAGKEEKNGQFTGE